MMYSPRGLRRHSTYLTVQPDPLVVHGRTRGACALLRDRWFLRRVDPDRVRQHGWFGHLPHEALRVRGAGGQEHLLLGVTHRGGPPVVHGCRCHQPDASVAMLAVVPGEERLAEDTGVLDRPEPRGELRAVLQRLELGFGERIVVGDLGARMAPRHSEIRQQQRHGLAGYRRAPIGVEEQLAW